MSAHKTSPEQGDALHAPGPHIVPMPFRTDVLLARTVPFERHR